MTETTTNLRKKRKYAIYDRLMHMNVQEYKVVLNKLPLILNVSRRTFERYIYATMDETTQISADRLAIVAKFLNCSMEDLINYEVPRVTLRELQKVVRGKIQAEYGLNK